MQGTITYKCPNCDAGLLFDPEKQKFICEFCISEFSEDELRNTEAAKKSAEQENEEKLFSEDTNEYNCPSCGAEIITDVNTIAETCYYCHNPIILKGKVSANMKPSKIIPFKFDKDEAKKTFLDFAKKKRFTPKYYASEENAENIRGVYYPFWVVDADTVADATYSAENIRTWRSGDYRYTEVSYYDVMRGGNIHFEDITSCAITNEDKEMLEGILPYPTDCHKEFSMPYLQGFVAKKKDIEREMLNSEVRGKMNSYASSLLKETVRGYESVDEKFLNVKVDKSHWEYTLIPIWILTYKYKEKNYTYAMNGYTGKVYGRLPVSVAKLLLLFGATFLTSFLIAMLFGFFVL